MKNKIKTALLIIAAVLLLTACGESDVPTGRLRTPITNFAAYYAIVDADDEMHLLEGGDCQNLLYWIESAPKTAVVDSDITSVFDMRFVFTNSKDVKVEDNVCYIPHTAKTHAVYIDKENGIIQFDNTAYRLEESENTEMFYEGIDVYLAAE